MLSHKHRIWELISQQWLNNSQWNHTIDSSVLCNQLLKLIGKQMVLILYHGRIENNQVVDARPYMQSVRQWWQSSLAACQQWPLPSAVCTWLAPCCSEWWRLAVSQVASPAAPYLPTVTLVNLAQSPSLANLTTTFHSRNGHSWLKVVPVTWDASVISSPQNKYLQIISLHIKQCY